MSANLDKVNKSSNNRQWRSNATKAGAERQDNGIIALRAPRPNELPDYDPSETDEMIWAKLKSRFEVVRGMVEDVRDGRARGLIISGPGGVGKTEATDNVLTEWDPEGHKHTVSKGKVKATGLWRLLWKHRHEGHIVVFDDADSIWFEEDALNFLKVATDTLKKNKPRILTYGADYKMEDEEGTIPTRFEFKGSVIFLSNLDFDTHIDKGTKFAPHMEAMMTRCHYIDLAMRTKRDYLVRIFMVAQQGLFDDFDLDDQGKKDVLNFIGKYAAHLRELSLRMALKIAGLRTGKSNAGDWEKVAKVTCCRGLS